MSALGPRRMRPRVSACALAVASCSPASTTPAQQSNPGNESAQSAPRATASPTIDPDTALTSKNGQSGSSAQSGAQDGDTSVVVIVALEESADSEATLASINEAVFASFPGASASVERECRTPCAAMRCACLTGRWTRFAR